MKRTAFIKRRKRGSKYPNRRDWGYWQWLDTYRYHERCFVCRDIRVERCHIIAKGSGGYDVNNIVFLCRAHHEKSEKRMPAFCEEVGMYLEDVQAEACRLYITYIRETQSHPGGDAA